MCKNKLYKLHVHKNVNMKVSWTRLPNLTLLHRYVTRKTHLKVTNIKVEQT